MRGDQAPQEPQKVLDALNDILASKSFAKAQRLKVLLNYVVHAKLNNQTDNLNGYTIAIEVFERPESFDPQTDTLVRVTAARLRTKLKEYYETHEAKVKIVLPVRSYVPEFIFEQASEVETPQPELQQPSNKSSSVFTVKYPFLIATAILCITIISVLLITNQTDNQSLDAIEKNVIKLEHQVANQSVQLAKKYFDKEDYTNAAVHYQKAVNAEPQNTTILRALGETRYILAQYPLAKSAFESALAIDKKANSNSLAVAEDLFHMGNYYRKTRQFEQAQVTYLDALARIDQHQATTRLRVELYRGLAQAHTFLVHDKQATDFIQKAFDAYHTLPPFMMQSNKDLLIDLYATRGLIKKRQDMLLEAIIDLAKSTELATSHYGEGHSEIATQRGNLAVMYSKTGQHAQATIQYEHALRVTIQRFGAQHPNVAKLYNNMAGPLKSQKRYDEAMSYLQKAMAINKNSSSKFHISYALNLYNLGLIKHSIGEYDVALDYLQQSLGFYIQAYGEKHPEIGEIWDKIGNVHRNKGNKQQAQTYYHKALSLYQQALGTDHKTTIEQQTKLDLLIAGAAQNTTKTDKQLIP